MSNSDYQVSQTLDATGLRCPEPVMLLHKAVRAVKVGECVEVIATDPSTKRDVPNFCHFLGHELVLEREEGERFVYWVRKGR